MNELDKLTDTIKKLENSHLRPEVRRSSEALDKLLADDFFEFGSSGRIINKHECIAEGGVEVRDLSLHDFSIHPLSTDVVLATYRVEDATRQQTTLRSTIWRYIDDRWQMYFHQGTVVK